ncbi:MAG: hypothetical protein VKK62_08870 [Synechococcaceae cyanobacterium]|nr:hypothetical protein [Synechococcaceae cyanobacterium]
MTPANDHSLPRFNLGDALHDGMVAFRRAPRSFVLFALLLTGLQLLLVPLQERLFTVHGPSTRPLDLLLGLLGLVLSLTVSLWGTQGLVRGAWACLEGQRPRLPALLRWDGRGFRRLLGAWTAVSLLPLVPLLALLLALSLGLLLLQASPGLLSDELVVLLGGLLALLGLGSVGCLVLLATYLGVNQQFLAQITLLEDRNGWSSVNRGRRLADPQWVLLLLLLLIKGILLLIGGLLAFVTLGIAWIVAWPLVSCISTAAYRQLRRRELEALASLSPGD